MTLGLLALFFNYSRHLVSVSIAGSNWLKLDELGFSSIWTAVSFNPSQHFDTIGGHDGPYMTATAALVGSRWDVAILLGLEYCTE
jgi:hypothetical protein